MLDPIALIHATDQTRSLARSALPEARTAPAPDVSHRTRTRRPRRS